MESSPESPKSINSAVYGIQKLLRNLEKQWPALKKSDGSNTSDIHALGPVNLDSTRQEFANHIELIRTICSQFETEVLGDVMKMGAGADPAFRKHFTHLREQATLESTVTRTKDTLKMTKECLEEVTGEYDASQSKVQTQKLEKLGQSMGLVAFIDTTEKNGMPTTTITLGGNVIVVDIDLDEQGNVLRSSVSYESEALQNDHDDRMDQLLAQSLRSHNLDLFKRNLGALALLDRLNVKHTPTDFFLVVKALLNDAKLIYNQEILISSEDIVKVLMEGHGLPSYHLDFPGLSIAYWISKELVIGNDWAAVRSSIGKDENHPSLCKAAKILISFEECRQPQFFLPTNRSQYLLDFEETEESIKTGPNGEHLQVISEPSWPKFMQPLRYVKVLSTFPDAQAVPVRYVAKLDPPLPASDAIIRKIMTITSLAGEDLLNAVNIDNTPLSPAPSLEKLLVKNFDNDIDLLQKELWVITMKDIPNQVYKWTGPSETSGKMIHRIPFTHPVQLYNILQYLRQQQMFNTLFTSIFNSSAKRQGTQEKSQPLSLDNILQESESDDQLYIQIASISAPHTLHFTLLLPPSLQPDQSTLVPFSVEIPRNAPAHPVVRLHPPSSGEYDPMHQLSWNQEVFDAEKMTLVLQTSYSIPVLIRWLWHRIANYQGEYTVKTPRLGLKRSKNDDDDDDTKQRRIKMEM